MLSYFITINDFNIATILLIIVMTMRKFGLSYLFCGPCLVLHYPDVDLPALDCVIHSTENFWNLCVDDLSKTNIHSIFEMLLKKPE